MGLKKLMIMLPNEEIVYPGVKKLLPWNFSNGAEVPVFDVLTVHALNYVVGHAKHINRDNCSVFCRGQGQLYDNLRPSLYRKVPSPVKNAVRTANANLGALIDAILIDKPLLAELGFPTGSPAPAPELVEAMMQHYGVATRMLDAVDNHWVALWFGLHEQVTETSGGKECALYRKREIRATDIMEALVDSDGTPKEGGDPKELLAKHLYQYILLIASGEAEAEHARTLDLRLSLPQVFMRPHAQHGVMLDYKGDRPADGVLDFSSSVVGIVRIRTDRAAQWLGSGHLISYANLFPSRAYDKGYSVLLDNADKFGNVFRQKITEYVYDVE